MKINEECWAAVDETGEIFYDGTDAGLAIDSSPEIIDMQIASAHGWRKSVKLRLVRVRIVEVKEKP